MFRSYIAASVLTMFISAGFTWAQDHEHTKADKLFDQFLRRGDFPLEFKVAVDRTSTTGLGIPAGTITARNTNIKFGNREEPALLLKINLYGLTPGAHAFHLHEHPDCGAKDKSGQQGPGLAAGGHLFAEHTVGNEKKVYRSHLGNLPNLIVAADGKAVEDIVVPRLVLADLVNRAIMVHSTRDDYSSREACGVFR